MLPTGTLSHGHRYLWHSGARPASASTHSVDDRRDVHLDYFPESGLFEKVGEGGFCVILVGCRTPKGPIMGAVIDVMGE